MIPVRILLPAQLGLLLLELGDLGLIAFGKVFDHALSVHTAGQTTDDIAAVIQAADIAAAAYSGKGCHNDLSFIKKFTNNFLQKSEEPSVLFYRHVV